MDNFFSVGSATADVTPPLSIPFLTGEAEDLPKGVHDPLYARALVVGEGDDRVAHVVEDTLGCIRDILGSDRDFFDEVRQRVQADCGIPADRIMISATHGHGSPDTLGSICLRERDGAMDWLESHRDKLAAVIVAADTDRRPARLKIGTCQIEGVGRSRRHKGPSGKIEPVPYPSEDAGGSWGPVDNELTLLCFESAKGEPAVIVTHYTCHPVSVQCQPLLTADFPGVVTSVLEKTVAGCRTCIFVQGACGDINPWFGDEPDFERMVYYGNIIADAARKLLSRMQEDHFPTVSEMITDARSRRIMLPSAPIPTMAELEAEQARPFPERLADMPVWETMAYGSDRGREYLNRTALTRVEWGDHPRMAEIQVLRIGDVALAGIPGEPFAEMGLDIKALDGPAYPLCAGFTNGYLGYIPPPHEWDAGGYEATLGIYSVVGRLASDTMRDTAAELIGELWP